MSNKYHDQDNQGQGESNGRFAGDGNKPGGRHVEEDGTEFADHLKGTDGDDTMDGLGGDDVIVGRGGADMLMGGDGNDDLEGGEGDDTLEGGADNDTFAHSGIGEDGDGFDTIVEGDFEVATPGEEEGTWEIADKVKIDADSFDFTAVEAEGITGLELLDYVRVVDGVVEVDRDGAGEASEFEGIVDTSLGEADDGVAIEIGGTEYVWEGDGWTMVA